MGQAWSQPRSVSCSVFSARAQLSASNIANALVFGGIGVGVSWIGESLRQSRVRATASTQDALTREAHLRSILETIPDAMIVIDERGIVQSFSSAASRLFGYANGAELLNRAPLSEARCFVIDYKMPGVNGLDLLADLRSRDIVAPAILIITHPSNAVRERAATTGTPLIEKPLIGDALF